MALVRKHLVALRLQSVKPALASSNFVVTFRVSDEFVEGCPECPLRAMSIAFAFRFLVLWEGLLAKIAGSTTLWPGSHDAPCPHGSPCCMIAFQESLHAQLG